MVTGFGLAKRIGLLHRFRFRFIEPLEFGAWVGHECHDDDYDAAKVLLHLRVVAVNVKVADQSACMPGGSLSDTAGHKNAAPFTLSCQ